MRGRLRPPRCFPRPLVCLTRYGLAASLWLGMLAAAEAIVIEGAAPGVQTVYDRFVQGSYPGTAANPPRANPSFIGQQFDLSGIGWDDGKPNEPKTIHAVALISPQYFLCAAHSPPGSTLHFLSRDGARRTYQVDARNYRTITFTGSDGAQESDLYLGRLLQPIAAADGVGYFPILYLGETDVRSPRSFDPYVGVALYNYSGSLDARLGTNTLERIAESALDETLMKNICMFYDQDLQAGETKLEPGDSGGPTFGVSSNGVFGLLGTHSEVRGLVSQDAFAAYTPFIAQINAAMAADGQKVTLVPADLAPPADDRFVFKATVSFQVTSVGVAGTAEKLIRKNLATDDLVNLALGRPLRTKLSKTREILAVLGAFESPSTAPAARLIIYNKDENVVVATVATLNELDYSLAHLKTTSKGQGIVRGEFVATTQGTPASNGLLGSKFYATGTGGGPRVPGFDLSQLRPSGTATLQGRFKFNFTEPGGQMVTFDGFLTKGIVRASGKRIGLNPRQ